MQSQPFGFEFGVLSAQVRFCIGYSALLDILFREKQGTHLIFTYAPEAETSRCGEPSCVCYFLRRALGKNALGFCKFLAIGCVPFATTFQFCLVMGSAVFGGSFVVGIGIIFVALCGSCDSLDSVLLILVLFVLDCRLAVNGCIRVDILIRWHSAQAFDAWMAGIYLCKWVCALPAEHVFLAPEKFLRSQVQHTPE